MSSSPAPSDRHTHVAATTEPETTYSVQWRCPNMDKHGPYTDSLPKPCSECYSLLVTATRIPYSVGEVASDIEAAARSAATPSPRLVSVEHFEGDGRIVSRVWQTFHWLTVTGNDTPDQIDVESLLPAVPETIYSEQGRALR